MALVLSVISTMWQVAVVPVPLETMTRSPLLKPERTEACLLVAVEVVKVWLAT